MVEEPANPSHADVYCNIAMSRYSSVIGIFFLITLIASAQLLWVFDSMSFLGSSLFWIDWLERGLYLSAIIPIIWLCSSLYTGINMWRNRSMFACGIRYIVNLLIHGLISLLSLTFLVIILLTDRPFDLQGRMVVALCVILGLQLVLILVSRLGTEQLLTRRLTWKSFLISLSTVAILAFLLSPTSYFVTYPGLSMSINHYAQVDTPPAQELGDASTRGDVIGVLVFDRPAFPVDWLYARLFPHYELRRIEPTDPPLGERLQAVRVMQLNANDVASAIAFKEAGLGKGVLYHGTRVVGLVSGTAAAEKLREGDTILQINDRTIQSAAQVIQTMQQIKPDETIALLIARGNERIEMAVEAVSHPEDRERGMLGVQLMDDIRLDLPYTVSFNSYIIHAGGPSHGAMLTLTLLNQLTSEDLTKGLKVAGTGTIRIDGSVGPIGGIKQKAYTVERAGADVFFVPFQQYEQARQGTESLLIVPVKNFSDILQWLNNHD